MNLQQVTSDLKSGEVFIINAGTIPGLFCDASSHLGVSKIYNLKKRSESKPFAIFLPHVDSITDYAEVSTDDVHFIRSLEYHNCTLILKPKSGINIDPRLITETIGIRICQAPEVEDIVQHVVLAATSVNISGESALLSMPNDSTYFGVNVIKSNIACLGGASEVWNISTRTRVR